MLLKKRYSAWSRQKRSLTDAIKQRRIFHKENLYLNEQKPDDSNTHLIEYDLTPSTNTIRRGRCVRYTCPAIERLFSELVLFRSGHFVCKSSFHALKALFGS